MTGSRRGLATMLRQLVEVITATPSPRRHLSVSHTRAPTSAGGALMQAVDTALGVVSSSLVGRQMNRGDRIALRASHCHDFAG